jgi:uncharacterized membrane protein (Fun14 family)
MRALIKIALALAAIFTLTFVVIRLTGVLDIVQIKAWLLAAQGWSPWVVGGIVAALLWVDIVIAVPTLAVALAAGYFLGFAHGALATFSGLVLSGISGYGLGHVLGERALRRGRSVVPAARFGDDHAIARRAHLARNLVVHRRDYAHVAASFCSRLANQYCALYVGGHLRRLHQHGRRPDARYLCDDSPVAHSLVELVFFSSLDQEFARLI